MSAHTGYRVDGFQAASRDALARFREKGAAWTLFRSR